jgi:peroxiredoxin
MRVLALGPGDEAPDCTVTCDDGGPRRLSEFRGSPLVLVFHPPHWNLADAEYVVMYNRLIANLPGIAGARLLSVGGDGPWRDLTFADDAMTIALLADTSRRAGDAARRFGVANETAVFVLDAERVIRWRHDGRGTADAVELARVLSEASSPAAARHGVWSRHEFVATALGVTLAIVLEPHLVRAESITSAIPSSL